MRPVILVVLDGFGERASGSANAIRLARTPTLARLYADYPHGLLDASGLAVGLPDGQMGNSEVGHMNLGAGRVVYQDLTRINKSIADGDFFTNPALVDAVDRARDGGRALHLLGLTSPGGVHASLDHAYALVELARRRGLTRVFWHAFLDGRDTPPTSAAGYLEEVVRRLGELGTGRVATVCGRYWAMDRDTRWDRVEKAYDLVTRGIGRPVTDPVAAVAEAYVAGETDEFVKPIVVVEGGAPVATLADGDSVVFFNFRADRARELTRAIAMPDPVGFTRTVQPHLAAFVCLALYDVRFGLPVAYAPQSLDRLLGAVIAEQGWKQLRTAETEKYAHVTFFFNGGVERPFPGEERRLVESRRDVATYDIAPAMSAEPVTDEVVRAIESGGYAFVLVNFANPDMVGHTGLLEPAVAAIETVDACLGRIVAAARAKGAAVVITADHGNCETMVDPDTGEPHTAHTTNPVPVLVVDDTRRACGVRTGGRLADVAPTVLELLGLPQPAEMDGRSLLVPPPADRSRVS